MFELLAKPPSFGAYLVQLLIAYCGPMIGFVVVDRALGGTDSATWQILAYLIVGALGLNFALGLCAVLPNWVQEGCWVWTVPSFCWVVVTCSTLLHGGPAEFEDMLYTKSGPMEGERGWLIFLVTLPTWGCCWYSATMYRCRKAFERHVRRCPREVSGQAGQG